MTKTPDVEGLVERLKVRAHEVRSYGMTQAGAYCRNFVCLPAAEGLEEAATLLERQQLVLEVVGEEGDTAQSQPGCAEKGPQLQSQSLLEPYVPVAIYFEGADTLEYVVRDVPIVTRPVHPGVDVLVTADTREPVGWRIYGWSRVAPREAASPAERNALPRETSEDIARQDLEMMRKALEGDDG